MKLVLGEIDLQPICGKLVNTLPMYSLYMCESTADR